MNVFVSFILNIFFSPWIRINLCLLFETFVSFFSLGVNLFLLFTQIFSFFSDGDVFVSFIYTNVLFLLMGICVFAIFFLPWRELCRHEILPLGHPRRQHHILLFTNIASSWSWWPRWLWWRWWWWWRWSEKERMHKMQGKEYPNQPSECLCIAAPINILVIFTSTTNYSDFSRWKITENTTNIMLGYIQCG